jgi:hypothetical protein
VIEAYRTAVFDWRDEEARLEDPDSLEQLRSKLDGESAESREGALLQLDLVGNLPVGSETALRDLEVLASERFYFARIRRGGLKLRAEGDGWLEGLPPGAPRAAAERLLTEAAQDGAPGEVARRALLLLRELAEEVEAR